jgi:hypothetical protein
MSCFCLYIQHVLHCLGVWRDYWARFNSSTLMGLFNSAFFHGLSHRLTGVTEMNSLFLHNQILPHCLCPSSFPHANTPCTTYLIPAPSQATPPGGLLRRRTPQAITPPDTRYASTATTLPVGTVTAERGMSQRRSRPSNRTAGYCNGCSAHTCNISCTKLIKQRNAVTMIRHRKDSMLWKTQSPHNTTLNAPHASFMPKPKARYT